MFQLKFKDTSPSCYRLIRRTTERGFMECTLCNLACPYGEGNETKGIPGVPGVI
jgi:epoxyqueuosine reductase